MGISVLEQIGQIIGVKPAHEDVAKAIHVFELFRGFRDDDGQINACKTLIELALAKEKNKEFIIDFDGIKKAIEMTASEDSKIQVAGLGLLQVLANTEERRSQMVNERAMVHAGRILHKQNARTAPAAAQLIETLLQDKEAVQSRTLGEGKVLTGLVLLARSNINDAHPHVAECIALLAKNPNLCSPLVRIRVIEAMSYMLTGYPVREVVVSVTKALHSITSNRDLVAKCVQHGAVPMLVAGIEKIYPDDTVVMNLHSLTNCRLDVTFRLITQSAFGTKHVVDAFKRAPEGSAMQNHAMKLLLFIARKADLAGYVRDEGGLDLFYERVIPDDPGSVIEVCRGLKGIAGLAQLQDVQERIVKDRLDVLQAVFAAGQHHSGQQIAEAVSLILERLTEQPDMQPLLMEHSNFRNMVLRYGRSEDVATRRNAALALSRLSQNQDVVSFFEVPRHMDVLISCSGFDDKVVRRLGSIAVASTVFVAGADASIDARIGLRTLVEFGLDAANDNSKNPDYQIQLQAVTALGLIALNEQVEDFFVESGAVSLIDKFADSPNAEVRQMAMVAFSNYRGMLHFKKLAKLIPLRTPKAVFSISISEIERIHSVLHRIAMGHPIDDVEDASHAADLCRVGVGIIASANYDQGNALRFIRCHGFEIVELYMTFTMRNKPELDPWGPEVLESIMRAVGNIGRNQDLVQRFIEFDGINDEPGCLVRQFVSVMAGCQGLILEEQKLIAVSCRALDKLCFKSEKVQEAFLDAGVLEYVIEFASQNLDYEVKLKAASAIASIATNEERTIRVYNAGVMKCIMDLMLMKGRHAAVHTGASLLSKLCLTEQCQTVVLKKIKWTKIVQLLRHPSHDIREIVAELVDRISHNRLHGLKYMMDAMDAGLLPPLVEMARSTDKEMQRSAVRTLRTLTHNSEARERLKVLRFPEDWSLLARCYDDDVRCMAAETVANMMSCTDPTESLISKDAMIAFLDLIASGDHRFSIEAARSLATMIKFSDVQSLVSECNGEKVLLDLARSVKIDAQKYALRSLYRMSYMGKVQEKIAMHDGLMLLFNLSEKLVDRDDEVEVLAIRIIANVAINPYSHEAIGAVGGGVALYELSQGNMDPDTPESIVEVKKQVAEVALSNMNGPRHIAETPILRGKFRGLTKAHLKSLEEALAQFASVPVNRAVANILANKATVPDHITVLLSEGGDKILLDLVKYDDWLTQSDAARGIGNVALTEAGRKQLTESGAMQTMCEVMCRKFHRESHPELVMEIFTAMANLCQPAPGFDSYRNVIHLFTNGLLPVIVQNTSGSDDEELTYQAARLVAACNLGDKTQAQQQPEGDRAGGAKQTPRRQRDEREIVDGNGRTGKEGENRGRAVPRQINRPGHNSVESQATMLSSDLNSIPSAEVLEATPRDKD